MLVTYKSPQTIATALINFKIQGIRDSVVITGSHLCGKCVLCNKGRKGEMVRKMSIKLKSGKIVKLKNNLNCKKKRVYAAKCNECDKH